MTLIRSSYLSLLIILLTLIFPLSGRASPDDLALLAKGGTGGWLNVAHPLTADDLQAHPAILLDFWTYGCVNCMQIVPDLEALQKTFGGNLLVIGVHSAKFTGEQNNDRILAAIRRFGVTHPVINDSDFGIWNNFGIQAWPTLVLLNSQGDQQSVYEGEGHIEELTADIRKLLAANPDAAAPPADNLLAPVADSAILSFPARLTWDETSQLFFVADTGHNRILGFDEAGAVKVIIGAGGRGLHDGDFPTAQFDHPRGVALLNDDLYIADTGNHALRLANLRTHAVTTVAGTGEQGTDRDVHGAPAKTTALASPWDVEPAPDGKTLAIAMAGLHQLWSYDPESGKLSILAGTGQEDIVDGPARDASLAQPSALARAGDVLFFADAESSALRELDADGRVRTRIGTGLFDFGMVDGKYPDARLQHPQGIWADKKQVVIADTYNNTLRQYDRRTKTLSTLKLPDNALNEPGDVLVQGSIAWVTDTNDNAIKKIDLATGAVSDFPLSLPR